MKEFSAADKTQVINNSAKIHKENRNLISKYAIRECIL